MKKTVSLILAIVMLVVSVPLFAFAETENEYPLIVVPGFSASYLYAVEDDGSERQLWGSFEGLGIVDIVLSNIAKLAIGLGGTFVGAPGYLADTLSGGIVEILGDIACNPDGTPVVKTVTYPNEPAITNYAYLIEEKGSMHAAEIEILSDIADEYGDLGFGNIFSFQTDFRLSVVDAIENLREYIDAVLEYTGSDKVNIFAVSYGGQITSSYLNVYGHEGKVHNAVLTVPAIGGAALALDIMNENVTFDEETLFYFLENGLMLEEDINWLMKAHALGFLDELLNLLIKGGIKDIIGFWGSIWDFIPGEYYDELKDKYLDPVENAVLIEKSDRFHYEILPSMSEKLQDCVDNGTNIYIVAGFGNPAVTGLNEQSDGIIHLSAATGADCAPFGKRFADGYMGSYSSCSDTSHNHMSPGMEVDASAAYLPEQTWFVDGLFHGMTWKDDYTISLCKKLLFSDELISVDSFNEYPQFRYSTNVCHAVDFYFDCCEYGFVSSESEALIIKNLSEEYKIQLISISASGADFEYELPCFTVLEPSEEIVVNFDAALPEKSYSTTDVCVNFAFIGNLTTQGERTLSFNIMNGEAPEFDSENPYSEAAQPTVFDRFMNKCIEYILVKTGFYDFIKMFVNCFFSMFM